MPNHFCKVQKLHIPFQFAQSKRKPHFHDSSTESRVDERQKQQQQKHAGTTFLRLVFFCGECELAYTVKNSCETTENVQ